MVGDQQAGDRGQESISEVCYCHFVGHNQLYLPARNSHDESTLHRFYKKQFLGVKSVFRSDLVNLSAFALK